jgi:hypothetical protein
MTYPKCPSIVTVVLHGKHTNSATVIVCHQSVRVEALVIEHRLTSPSL